MPDSSKPLHKRRTKYAVETQMLNTWENCWRDENGELFFFATRREAEREIRKHLEDCLEAVADGYLEDAPEPSEFRIVKVRG